MLNKYAIWYNEPFFLNIKSAIEADLKTEVVIFQWNFFKKISEDLGKHSEIHSVIDDSNDIH